MTKEIKKVLSKVLFAVTIFVTASCIVSAKENVYYVNNNGVEMTEEQYNFLLNFCDEDMISSMTQKRFDLKMSTVDYSLSSTYVVETTTYDRFGNVIDTISTEVDSEQEAIDMADRLNQITTYAEATHTTNAKKLTFVVTRNYLNGAYRIVFSTDTQWLNNKLPKIKSYDVSAHRFTTSGSLFLNAINGEGYQTYSNGSITYSYKGDNTVSYHNGYGTSMNIYDEAKGNLRLSLDVVYEYSGSGTVTGYGTYQHATEYISLDESQDYTFAAGGLGNVLKYNNSTIASYYDNMKGVSVSLKV